MDQMPAPPKATPPTRMTKGMSEDVSRVVLDALNRGLTRGQISGVVGISKRAITRITSNMKKHGTARPPPTGAKLGRPVKLTKPQADAMIVWMAERDHTFYVKDLVAFLKEQYRYKGCDGTIRRCLVRAGYRRKLPWHKSEMTVWIPPNYRPVFVTASKSSKKKAPTKPTEQQETQDSPDEENDDTSPEDDDEPVSVEFEQPQATYHDEHIPQTGIDPALEQQQLQSGTSEHTLPQHSFISPYTPAGHGDGASLTPYNYTHHDPLQQQQYQHPGHASMQQQPAMQQSRQQMQQPQAPMLGTQSNAQSPIDSVAQSPKTKVRAPRKIPAKSKPTQLTALQQEIMQKDALIAQLQQQLAQQYPNGEQQQLPQQMMTNHQPPQAVQLGQRHSSHDLTGQRPSAHELAGQQTQAQHMHQYPQYSQPY